MLRSLLCGSDLGLEKVLRVSVLPPFHFGHAGLCHAVKLVAKIPDAPVSNWSSPKGHIHVYPASQSAFRSHGSAARMELLRQIWLHPKSAKVVMFWHRTGKESLGQIEKA